MPYEDREHRAVEAAPEAPTTAAPASAGPERTAVGREDLRRAGGYEAQRQLLRPPAGRAGSANVAGSATPAGAKPDPGAWHPLLALEARLMARPAFLGTAVASLRRGLEVQVLRSEGSWSLVTTRDGRQGWLHANRFRKRDLKLRPGETGAGTQRGDEGPGSAGQAMTGRG